MSTLHCQLLIVLKGGYAVQEKISQGQFSKLIAVIIISTVFLRLPRELALVAEWDSPFSLILGYGAAWLIGLIVIWISLKHPEDTFVGYSKKILGPFFGWIFGLMVFLVFMNFCILAIRISGITYAVAGYTNTPMIVFCGVIVLLAVWILKEGLEVLGRVVEVIYVPLILSIIFLPLLVLNKIELNNLLPVLAFGPEPVLKGAVLAFSIGVKHVFLVGLLISMIQNLNKKVYIAYLYGVSVGTFMILLMVISTIGVFSVGDVQRFYLPPYQLAKVVEIGGFISGVEVILLGIWTIASLLEVTIFLYISVVIISQLLNVNYRDILLPLAFLFLSMSMAPMDSFQVEREIGFLGIYGVIPIILLFVLLMIPGQLLYQRAIKNKFRTGDDFNK